METESAETETRSVEDENFDQIFPSKIRKLSAQHWTPVRVAAEAARLLVTVPGSAFCMWAAVRPSFVVAAFDRYDAFYVYNPFEENMARAHKIDAAVPLSPLPFKRSNHHVATQLGAMPPGTRIVTYAGYADEIPACYDCELALFRDELKLWVKRREYDPDIEHLGLCISCSYRGPIGWAPPRT